jgi:hypothetical protein
MDLAPIALFVYNRPSHTMRTLEALAANTLASKSILYIFQDGPKPGASAEDLNKINQVEKIIEGTTGFQRVVLSKRSVNVGLANNIINGITEVVNQHGKIIVMEDDLLTSPFFLQYLNDGLEVYKSSCNVYAINGYMFPIETEAISVFLSPLATSTWGWATWADRWKAFERKPVYKDLIQKNKFLRSRFNLADYNYADMLDNMNSWGIRWYYSVFMRNGLGLFPTKSLCYNIGVGEESTHTKREIQQMEIFTDRLPMVFVESINIEVHEKLLRFFTIKEIPRRTTVLKRLSNRLSHFLKL